MDIKIVIQRITETFILMGVVVMPMAYSLDASLLEVSDRKERQGKLNAIHSALDDSKSAYETIPDARAMKARGEEDVERAERDLITIGQRKRQVREQLAKHMYAMDDFQERYGVDPYNAEELQAFLEEQRPHLAEILQQYARLQYVQQSRTGAFGTLSIALTNSLSDHVLQHSRFHALRTTRMRMFADATMITHMSPNLVVLQNEHEKLVQEFHGALGDLDTAETRIVRGETRLQEIKRVVAHVDQKIRQMQVELAAYDERIRQRAETALLEKGLLDGPVRHAAAPSFQWPATGRMSAAYLDPGYLDHFGVPHRGIDIVQAQGTPVLGSADGVVYYVQHGGAHGYSFVLIGHQGGYATLYGHLSAIYVTAGDDIYAGQIIGLSGGTPGTIGAGPITTGAHVHFEVVHNGVHVDPLTILP